MNLSCQRLASLALVSLLGCMGQVSGIDGLGNPSGNSDNDSVANPGDAGSVIDDGPTDMGGDTAAGDGDGDGDSGGDETDEPEEEDIDWPDGDPGCGLAAAAFCDTFDAPAANTSGRSFELDSTRWGLARNEPGIGKPYEIGVGSVSQCRSDIPAKVAPPGDTRICDGNANVQSRHLLTVTAAQNYGSNDYRIRQPFDFANRTGTIVFDADAFNIGLLGWIAIAVTEEPIPSPSFSLIPEAGNFEGGVIPRNGLTIELNGVCGTSDTIVTVVNEYRDYVDYTHEQDTLAPECIEVEHHRLNRFEVKLSRTHLELWATPYSNDGVTFGASRLVASTDLDLTFTRGYVHLITRNHATDKYFDDMVHPPDTREAWVVRWDNVGFDGPVIGNTREFEVPDALVPAPDNSVAVGYMLADAGNATKRTLTIKGVTGSAQATRARLAMNVHYFGNFTNAGITTWGISYRLNGKAWRTYDLTTAEETLFADGVQLEGDAAGSLNALSIGVMGHVFDIDRDDLIDGDNVLEIATLNVPFAGYPPPLANVDLILTLPP